MPLRFRRKSTRKPLRRRARVVRRRAAPRRSIGTRPINVAHVHENYDLNVTAGQPFPFSQAIGTLNRAGSIAQYFQEYRISSVKFMFKPKWDTYPVDLTSAQQQLPYLFFTQDPANTLPNGLDYLAMTQMGIKPVRMDDKTIVRKMKPTVVMFSPTSATSALPSTLRKSPWLPTSSTQGGAFSLNNVLHHGANWLITPANTSDTSNYVVTVEVVVEFRRPYVNVL